MATATFIEHDGTEHVVKAANGLTLMEVAARTSVAGIEAACGGACACATCHVCVEPPWIGTISAPGAAEADMPEFAVERRPPSRLSCQIRITEALDGLTVRLPISQH